MNQNQTCAPWTDINRLASWNFVIFQLVDLTSGAITILSSIFAITVVSKRSIFENSTKILSFLNIFYGVVYTITYGLEAATIVYKHFFKLDKPCEVLQQESACAPYMKTLLTCTSGMIYCQTGLILERTYASFTKNHNTKKSLAIGIAIALFVVLSSCLTGPIIYWDDPLTGAILACFVFPKQSSARSQVYFFVVTGVTVFNFGASIWLRKFNEKLEYQIRFKLCARFHKREVIESTGTICFLTFSQFIFMFIYSFGISILKFIREKITTEQYHFWVVWFYTVPFIAMLFPILLIYRIQKINAFRTQRLIGISRTKQSLEEHINQMKVIWK